MDQSNLFQWILTVLGLPFFRDVVSFSIGRGDSVGIAAAKIVFVALPALSCMLAYWITILCLLTSVIRSERREFVTLMFITWWDLGRSIFSFWGGVFKFSLTFVMACVGAIRLTCLGLVGAVATVATAPFSIAKNMGTNVMAPGTPWIAVLLTGFWCVLEAGIFTFVCSQLVIDTMGGLTGSALTPSMIRAPLFIFMLFLVLGSYAVLANWSASIKSRDFLSIIKIGIIELVAAFVEVIFLYREFVDALVPWFAQHSSGNFELGIIGTLGIAGLTWFGIRGVSWFLFASSGIPTIIAIISRRGLEHEYVGPEGRSKSNAVAEITAGIQKIKKDLEWTKDEGEKVLESFILPPLSIVAAAINFCVLLLNRQHLFELPFKTMDDLKRTQVNVDKLSASQVKSIAQKRAA